MLQLQNEEETTLTEQGEASGNAFWILQTPLTGVLPSTTANGVYFDIMGI